jgi:hypothetical protein
VGDVEEEAEEVHDVHDVHVADEADEAMARMGAAGRWAGPRVRAAEPAAPRLRGSSRARDLLR